MHNSNRETKDWLETIYTFSQKGRMYNSIDNGYKWCDETLILVMMGTMINFLRTNNHLQNKNNLYFW